MLNKIRIVLIVVAVVLAAAIGVLCVILFGSKSGGTSKPTTTPQSTVESTSSEESSSSSTTTVESTPQQTTTTSSESLPVESSTSQPVEEKPKGEFNQRFKELQLRLTYGEHWKLMLTENQKNLAADSLFVGDSICSGFGTYGLVDWKNVYAAGSVGARNFFDIDIKYYGEVKPYNEALAEKNPTRVFTWMGMNDVNVTDAATYAKNYKGIIDYTLENSEAEVIVFAMTPVNSDFTSNEKIASFNAALKSMIEENYTERVRFLDFAYVVTDSLGYLNTGYDAGDGVHLVPDVYYLAMIEICDQLGLES